MLNSTQSILQPRVDFVQRPVVLLVQVAGSMDKPLVPRQIDAGLELEQGGSNDWCINQYCESCELNKNLLRRFGADTISAPDQSQIKTDPILK